MSSPTEGQTQSTTASRQTHLPDDEASTPELLARFQATEPYRWQLKEYRAQLLLQRVVRQETQLALPLCRRILTAILDGAIVARLLVDAIERLNELPLATTTELPLQQARERAIML